MKPEEILDLLQEIYHDKVGGRTDEISPEMRLVEDLGLDSLRLITLVVEVEDRFQICIEEEEEDEIVRLSDLVEVIQRKAGDR